MERILATALFVEFSAAIVIKYLFRQQKGPYDIGTWC